MYPSLSFTQIPLGFIADDQLEEGSPEMGVGHAVHQRVGGVAHEEEIPEAQVVAVAEDIHPERQPGDEEDHATQKQHSGRPPVHGQSVADAGSGGGGGGGGGRHGGQLLSVSGPATGQLGGGRQTDDLLVGGELGSLAFAAVQLLVFLRLRHRGRGMNE